MKVYLGATRLAQIDNLFEMEMDIVSVWIPSEGDPRINIGVQRIHVRIEGKGTAK